MSTARTRNFLRTVKPLCFGVWKEYGVLPSVTAAQAALESTWGTSGLTRQANNYFGIKAVRGQLGYVANTYEDGAGGMQMQRASFARYASIGESFEGYGRLMNASRYSGVPGERDPVRAATRIRNAGYATDRNYVPKVMSIINRHNLRAWDREAFAGGTGGYTGNLAGMVGGGGGGSSVQLEGEQFKTFKNDFIKKNRYTRPGDKLRGVRGVVIRQAGSNGSSVDAIKRHLSNGGGGIEGGFHILVDNKKTVGIVPLDEKLNHSKGNSKFNHFTTNANNTTLSIGIVANSRGRFSNQALARALAVVAELVNRYSFPTEFIKRGYDVDGRNDPTHWVENQFDYSTFIGLVDYQKNQNVPLMNEDLEQYFKDMSSNDSVDVPLVAEGTVGKILELARILETYNMRYAMVHIPNIRPNGHVDCSAFVQYVYRNAAGIELPRTSREQALRGRRIPRHQSRPGDLIFFSSRPGGVITHVGIITNNGGTTMVNSRTSGRNTIAFQNVFEGPGGHGYVSHCTRLLSEKDMTGTQGGSTSIPGRPDYDPTKSYAIEIKKSINAYASDNESSTSVRRLGRGTTLRVRSVGTNAYRVGEGLWIKMSDSDSYKLHETGSISNPIGAISVKGTVTVKSMPSHAAPNVLQSGAPKRKVKGEYVEVFAVDNGMYLISNPGRTGFEEWVSSSGGDYEDYLVKGSVGPVGGAEEIRGITFNAQSFRLLEGEKTSGGHTPSQGRTLSANPGDYSIGDRLYVEISSMPDMTGDYIVEHHDYSLNLGTVGIYVDNARDDTLFGRRTAMVSKED